MREHVCVFMHLIEQEREKACESVTEKSTNVILQGDQTYPLRMNEISHASAAFPLSWTCVSAGERTIVPPPDGDLVCDTHFCGGDPECVVPVYGLMQPCWHSTINSLSEM